ncbi:MAG: LysM peptidoglycan-binding domain-containing protein, partial [Acetatifactor sp.]|nr:LysM peptidoglycan-binding domain-containing protein [Acetatifactor sp.]
SYTVRTNNEYHWNTVTFSIVEGRLAEGLQMYPSTGEIYGVPLETGEFPITVRADYSNPDFLPSYAQLTLIVKDNTDTNISTATDPGYDIIQPVPNMSLNALPGSNSQILVSKEEYAEFVDLYLDGEKLVEGTDYTLEAGSTRITILNQTLTRKGTGTHTLGIEFRIKGFNVLRRAAQNFVVSENSNAGDNSGNGNSSDNGNIGGSGNGNGGDSGKNVSDNTETAETASEDEVTAIIYTVKPGDNLRKIAVKFYGISDYWRKIYADNANLIRNPGRIYVGQKLTIYLTKNKTFTELFENGNDYRVAPGDNLWKIAQRVYGDGRLWIKIYEANRAMIINPGRIRGGLLLKLPQR